MKKIVNFLLLFFFFSTFSCKEKNSISKGNNFEQHEVDTINLKKNLEYKPVTLRCLDEKYSALKCFDDKEKTIISFNEKNIIFNINKSNFKYDELNLPMELGYQTFLFENGIGKIIILDFFLENGSVIYAYYFDKNELKFLGKKEIVINEEVNPKILNVEQIDDGLIVSVAKNIKNINFKFSNAVKLNSFTEISNNKVDVNDSKNDSFKIIFSKDEENRLVIDEKSLNGIAKKSDLDQGKTASLLNIDIINILNDKKNGKKINFTDTEIYKILAYTINTTDPIYNKYFDSKMVSWGKYSFGDSRGGASLSEGIALGKYLTPQELSNLSKNFKENAYYHLENLKKIMEKTSWFEP